MNIKKDKGILYIGFTGLKGSGKSFSARKFIGLMSAFSDKVQMDIYSFADPVREMLNVIVDVDAIYRDNKKEEPLLGIGVTLRKLMQTLGTEWGRNTINEDIWTKVLEQRVLAEYGGFEFSPENPTVILIDDVRFQNEFDFILRRGGYVININSGSIGSDTHESERAAFNVDPIYKESVFEITNTMNANYVLELAKVAVKIAEIESLT